MEQVRDSKKSVYRKIGIRYKYLHFVACNPSTVCVSLDHYICIINFNPLMPGGNKKVTHTCVTFLLPPDIKELIFF